MTNNPSLFKTINDISTSNFPNGTLETACVAQIDDYTVATVNIHDMVYDSTRGLLCAVGNYYSDGTAVNDDGDTVEEQYVPLVALATASPITVSSATWVITSLIDCVYYQLQSPVTEQSGLYGVTIIPSTSANWGSTEAFMAVGHANTDMDEIGAGFNDMVSPNSCVTPIIVSVRPAGTCEYESSSVVGSRASWGWAGTDSVAISSFQPMFLSDLIYDEENDEICAVGTAVPSTGGPTSSGIVVESNFDVSPFHTDRFTFCLTDNNGAGTPTAPFIYRTIAQQNVDVNGVVDATKTLCMIGGASNFNGVSVGKGNLGVYQPDFSNAWSGTERYKALDSGSNDTQFWRSYIVNEAGGTTGDYFTNVTAIDRVTTDGEDIYMIMGTSANGPAVIAASGLSTGPDGGPQDNEIDPADQADITFNEIELRSSDVQSNLPSGYSAAADIAPLTCIGLENRKTKVLAGGEVAEGFVNPISGIGGTGFLISLSRATTYFNTDVQDNGELPQNTASFLKVFLIAGDTQDHFYLLNGRYGPVAYTTPTTGNMDSLSSVRPITNHKAQVYFEYILYDGIDSLIAKKLQQLGVRVTITNLEWYKQDILKQGLDLDADFFREWAESQVAENEKREKLANQYGAARPPKRQVRTEIFDDFNNREEILKEMDEYRDRDPMEEMPWSDEVGDIQEARKVEKEVEDKIRIEELTEDEASDEEKT